jgi:hypothetical protein
MHTATVRKDRTMAQQDKIGKHATTISRIDGRTFVTYHDTPVVTVDADGTVTLNSGGWRSSTTKTRINQAASQLGLRFSVYQRDFQWFVSVDDVTSPYRIVDLSIPYFSKYKTRTLPFRDGMRFYVERDARRTA